MKNLDLILIGIIAAFGLWRIWRERREHDIEVAALRGRRNLGRVK
jgi:hypothetical protein